jgi:hypothetical protein
VKKLSPSKHNEIKYLIQFYMGRENRDMEKYYCEKCRLLYSELELCKICGKLASQRIWIEVQKQEPKRDQKS